MSLKEANLKRNEMPLKLFFFCKEFIYTTIFTVLIIESTTYFDTTKR